MGHFEREAEIIVKMTKCRQCVHVREGVADTPTMSRSKLLL